MDGDLIADSSALTEKLKGYQEGDSVQVKVYRADGLREQAEERYIDIAKVSEGDYQDLTVVLKVIDQVERSL